MEEQIKTWLTSRVVWSALMGIISTVAGQYFNITIDEATQAQIVDAVFSLITVASGIAAIYYRIKATKKIAPKAEVVAAKEAAENAGA